MSPPTPPQLPPPGNPNPATPHSPVPAPGPNPPDSDVFDRIRALGIVRQDDDRWAAGVASGLARRWGVDPVLVRGGFVALSVLGVGVFLYGIGWLLLPHPDGRIHAQEVLRGTVTAGFVGSVIAILSGVSGAATTGGAGFSWGIGPLPLIVLAVVGWWLLRRGHHATTARPSPTGTTSGAPMSSTATSSTAMSSTATSSTGTAAPPAAAYEPPSTPAGYGGHETGYRPTPVPVPTPGPRTSDSRCDRAETRPYRPLTMIVIGTAVLAAVVTHLVTTSWAATWAVALGVVGLGLVLSGLAGRRGGLLVPAAIVLAVFSAANLSGSSAAAGDLSWAPVSSAAARSGVSMGAGEARIDLTAPGLLSAATADEPLTVPVQIGAGELSVVLPADVAASVDVNLGAGEIRDQVNDGQYAGLGRSHLVRTGTGEPVLVVTVNQGFGEVTISQDQSRPAGSTSPSPSPDTADTTATTGADR